MSESPKCAPKTTNNRRSLQSPRYLAWSILSTYEKKPAQGQERRLDRVIDHWLADLPADWPDSGRGWVSHHVWSVLRAWHPLNHWIAQLTGKRMKDTPAAVRTVLRLALVQLAQEAGLPKAIVVDESVSLLKAVGGTSGQCGLVNALLRQVANLSPQERQAALSTVSPWPKWLAARWKNVLTSEQLIEQQTLSTLPAPLGIRVNTLTGSIEDYLQQLNGAGVAYEQPLPAEMPEALVLPHWRGSVTHLPGFFDGRVTVQDVASSWVSRWVYPRPGEGVVDLCAAPGSKTCHLAALMEGQGELIAVDVSASRFDRLHDNVERLRLPNGWLTVQVADGTTWQPETGSSPVDAIVVDAPCSGLGTLRHHPEKLVDYQPEQLQAQPALQRALLFNALAQVRPGGGRVIYSVCSPDPSEGPEVVQAELTSLDGIRLDAERTLWPTTWHDGFYIARLIRE